jgi:hypothetical protein
MTSTATACIHGFPSEQCGSCRTCAHGLSASACPRCRAAVAPRKAPDPTGDLSVHEHAGSEIFYDPDVTGWRYRPVDGAASARSYRSAFLARRAVDEWQRTGGDVAPRPLRKGHRR